MHSKKTSLYISLTLSVRLLSKLSNIAVPETFQSCGLEFLCEQLTTCPLVYVQDFYSNIYIVNTFVPMFTTSVQGTCIFVTPKLISELVHVPRVAKSKHPNAPVFAPLSRCTSYHLLWTTIHLGLYPKYGDSWFCLGRSFVEYDHDLCPYSDLSL